MIKAMEREAIFDKFPEEEFLFADGFDEAIVGVDSKGLRLVYSIEACIETLMKDMCFEDAHEYFFFNVEGAYMGEKTPIFVYTRP